eukprot:CAMPEP_0174259592 /NCGR_PEP_ID=MMETSP0439-20130205/8403_1 /TAXON_ID=0 /ORGANISM="Stereomyxa ramosa, Strain Chinc5" /LENGTH=278 /DNA_ID=CAMNT_0015343549 /DNA_START=272 /DNA_END=1105 /DNA_ORIENTATION=-
MSSTERKAPIAVVPDIGAAALERGAWLGEIHTWHSPCPSDDGISLLTDVLLSLQTKEEFFFGVPLGHETQLRMPIGDFFNLLQNLRAKAPNNTTDVLCDATSVLRQVRSIKSKLEQEKLKTIGDLTSTAFDLLVPRLKCGMSELEVSREMKRILYGLGVETVPYLAIQSGHGGYDNIILPATQRTLSKGDLMVIDVGALYEGYFCDFDRNFYFGTPPKEIQKAHDVLQKATDVGIAACKPGTSCTQVWKEMAEVLSEEGYRVEEGRMGHGLGTQLTEW